jgi:hypothetical protein
MKPIPSLESVSAEYARLSALHAKLMARAADLDREIHSLHAQIGTEQAANRHGDRVASLLAGVDYSAAPPIKDQLAALAAEKAATDTAIRELAGQIALERQQASRLVVDRFIGEQAALATEFFKHIAAAAKAHAEFGEVRRQFHRAGVNPAGLHDFGEELFGDPGHRNGDVGIAMRAAVRRGYLKEADVPGAYK